ncbi:nuclear transport factor 2 family protein [Parahaliea sp. F7430]|uniref:Nuclear transport factor 2 family protein n=1 Tax=Sediminihaliea albiluteola TaxID=2758564 RepID=A0A7W2TTZ5_9GAMM|nr:nuclear transport factor 2 family protein [Sediminihaliea albiluteola]MBA6411902.1 nuclear transport factor 2 family protein [Sediminihaliea albiluteola]
MSNKTDYKAIVKQFFADLNAGKVDEVVSVYAEDGAVETMGNTLISGEFKGPELTKALTSIYDIFPKGLRFTVHGMIAEGEKVAVEATSAGEHISGQDYENQYHFLFEFDQGKLRRLREYMDTEQVTDVICRGQRRPFGAGAD